MYDCIVIGGGVVGTAIADALSMRGLKPLLLEKEDDVASGASRANSGIVHAGYDCVPGTLKAKFNVLGNRMFPSLTKDLDVPFVKTGSLVLARAGGEKTLEELLDRAVKNGVDAEIIDRKRIDEIQSGVNPDMVKALYAKDAGIVSPYKLTIAFCDRAILNGAEVRTNQTVVGVSNNDGAFTVRTQNARYECRYLINAAGAGAAGINALLGEENYETVFKKGEYFVLDKTENAKVSAVLFPLPDERGKGILVAPTADGNVIFGPTSVTCDDGDTSCTREGLDLVKEGVSKIFDNADYRAVIREYAGVRASVGEDFIIKESDKISNYFILAGICSPGLTSAPAIGEYVADEIAAREKRIFSGNPVKILRHERLKNLSADELNEKVKKDPKWGRIICRCETVTEAEIVNAIHSPLPAVTVDAVKRRVRAGMGRCQGGFCAPRVIDILSRELGIPVTEVKKGGEGSEMVKCRVKEAD